MIDQSHLPPGVEVVTTRSNGKPFAVSCPASEGLPADKAEQYGRRLSILLQHGNLDSALELLREAARELSRRRLRPTDATNLVDLLPLRLANLLSKHGIDTLGELRCQQDRLPSIPALGTWGKSVVSKVLSASDEGV